MDFDARPFPPTRHSVVLSLASDDAQAREGARTHLVDAYWRPVYGYLRLRRRLDPERAEDLTQGFFAHVLEKGTLDAFDPAKARFRTWVRLCLDGFVDNQIKAEMRQKRGGGAQHLALDFENAEGELQQVDVPVDGGLDDWFHQEWIRQLLRLSVEELRATTHNEVDFTIFERYDLDAPERDEKLRYEDLAEELGVSVTKVTNTLFAMRGKFRAIVLARLRALCASEEEFKEEARAVLGVRT